MSVPDSNKTELTREQVLAVAALANVTVTEEEVPLYQSQLSQILTYVHKLDELPTQDVPATAQVTGLTNVYRLDEIKESLSQGDALSGSAHAHEGTFMVDAIFEE